MPNPSTYDDANLILRLYELRREERMRAARKWYLEHFGPDTLADFRELCPSGSDSVIIESGASGAGSSRRRWIRFLRPAPEGQHFGSEHAEQMNESA